MIRKRITALFIMMICLASFSGSAAAAGIRDMIRFWGNGEPFEFKITSQAEKLPQFDRKRTEQLNRLLGHFSFSGKMDDREAMLSVYMDEEKMFTLSRTEIGGENKTALEADSSTFVIIPEDGNDTWTGLMTEEDEGISENLSIYNALEKYAVFFESLPAIYPELSGYGKILEKYKDYGTAEKKVNIHFTAEKWTECVMQNAPDIPEGSKVPDLRKMTFEGKQDIELLLKGDGTLLKVRYGGNAGISKDDMRIVRLEWKTVRNETVGRDELTLRTPDSNAARRNNLILEHLWRKAENGSEMLSWKAETDIVSEGIRTRRMSECSMESADGKTCGSWSQTITEKNRSDVREFIFEYASKTAGEYSGTLEIISKKDKIENVHIEAAFSLTPIKIPHAEDNFHEPVPVSREEYAAIRGNLVHRILVNLMSLPPEDLGFVTEGIPDETLKLILPDHEQ